LQDGIDPVSRLLFQFLKGIQIPWVNDQGFLADGVGTDAKGQTAVGVMQVIGRTDTHVMDPFGFGAAAELFKVPVKTLDLCKKFDIKAMGIEDADGIMGVDRGDKLIPRILDRFEVAGGNKSGHSSHGKVFDHHVFSLTASVMNP
jgi:hypothetical protein